MSIQECKYLNDLGGCTCAQPDSTYRYHHPDITYPFYLCSVPGYVDSQKKCSGYDEKPGPVLPETVIDKIG